MSEIIELKAFSKSIIKKEGAQTNLTWAADGQSFTIGSSSQVRLLDFTYMHKVAINHVEERMYHMMLGWQPVVILTLFGTILPVDLPAIPFYKRSTTASDLDIRHYRSVRGHCCIAASTSLNRDAGYPRRALLTSNPSLS
jgi:hypothetical protein